MDYLILVEIYESIQNLSGVMLHSLFRNSSLTLVNALDTATLQVFKVDTELIVDYFTSNVLNNILMV